MDNQPRRNGNKSSFKKRGDTPRGKRDGERSFKSFGDKPYKKRSDRRFSDDRSERTFDNNRRDFRNDRSDRSSFSDRKRPFNDDRPKRRFDRDQRDFNNDRPKKRFDRDQRDFDNDRPKRRFDRDNNHFDQDRPKRRFDRDQRDFGKDRPKRNFDGDKRSFSDRQERPFKKFGDKPFRKDGERSFGKSPRQAQFDDGTMKYYGVYSCKELYKKRFDDIKKVYLTEELVESFKLLLSKMSKASKFYKVVEPQELERLTDSTHHEGICIVAQKLEPTPFNSALRELKEECTKIAYLDGVDNPHNIGAVLRTAAHFGITHVLLPEAKPLAASGYRIAREGAENVQIISVANPVEDMKVLQKCGFSLITTSPREGSSLHDMTPPSKMVFILGGETDGVSDEVLEIADHRITIAGSGKVESLNISSAFSILAYHLCS